MKSAVLAALLGCPLVTTNICCNKCDESQIKTYSVDHIFNECGEACLVEKDFWKYKLFEPGLTKATAIDATPCADRNYTIYDKTDTHGIPHVLSITLDMYKPTKAEQEKENKTRMNQLGEVLEFAKNTIQEKFNQIWDCVFINSQFILKNNINMKIITLKKSMLKI